MRERKVKDYLYKRCKEAGLTIRKTMYQYRRDCPDQRILGHAWVELKGSEGKLRQTQIKEIETMRSCGEVVYVVSSVEEVDELIRKITWQSLSPVPTKKKSSTGKKIGTESGALWEEVRL